MILEAKWLKYGRQFVYHYEEIRKVLLQMKTMEQSTVCLTDRYGNYMQTGGYGDTFIVEIRRYLNAVTYSHMRADLKNEILAADTFVSMNGFTVSVPKSQILSKIQVCLLFEEFTDEMKFDNLNIFWKKIEL